MSTEPSPFGFGGRLEATFPSQVGVDITEVCNLACVHCPHEEFRRSPHYAGRHLDPALNRKLVEEIREFGQGRTVYLRYTGNGEPLLHPQGYEMVEHAVRNAGVSVSLTINGTVLEEVRMRRLLEAGLHLIDVSIDAVRPETYARIRVRGNLERTSAHVRQLIAWAREAGRGTKVVVSFVEQPANAAEAGEFERVWREEGVASVVIRRRHSCAGAKSGLAGERREAAAARQRYPCLYPWERIVLNARGDLSFCPADWVHGTVIAPYAGTTIRETWSGEFYRALREAHRRNDFSRHVHCGQCPDWEATRWPHQGRSYADMVGEFFPAR